MAIARTILVGDQPRRLVQPGDGQWRYARFQVLGANIRMRYDELAHEITAESGFIIFGSTSDVLASAAHIEACHMIREGSTNAVVFVTLE